MDSRFNWLVSVALLVLFAYTSTYFPEHLGTFMLIYIFAMLAITFAIAGRSARDIFRDLEYVKAGKPLVTVSSEEVAKLKSKDRDLNREMNEQVRATLPQLLAPFVFMLVLLVPAARESALQSLGNLLRPLSLSDNAQRFLTFLLFYGLLTFVLYAITYASGKYLEHIGGRLEIPSFYLVTDRGLILEGRTPIRAPIKAHSMKVDTRRKFIEIRVKTRVSVGGGASRVRLYSEDPRKLEAYLKALSEERG